MAIDLLNSRIIGSTQYLESQGLKFPGTQVASTDANTLDDYEEGTWTPSVGGTATYNVQKGTYTKIGNIVNVQFRIHINTLGTGSIYQMSGLPFTSTDDNSGLNIQTGSISYFANLAVSRVFLSLYVENNATTIQFPGLTTAAVTTNSGSSLFGNNAQLYGALSYRIG